MREPILVADMELVRVIITSVTTVVATAVATAVIQKTRIMIILAPFSITTVANIMAKTRRVPVSITT